jgi:DNA invertase Pin-like site-specific DNA recombinase
MQREQDPSQITGRLRALVRISVVGSEIESQKATIDGLARRVNNSINFYYEDIDRKRSEYHESKVIPRLLDDLENGDFDWLIVDKAQRIGTDNERELLHFLAEIEKRGGKIWSVSEGDLLASDALTGISLLLGSQSERKDQRNKAENVSRGMFNNAKAWNFNGAILPYGYDRLCIAADGTERFRLVEDRREANPDYLPGSKDPAHKKYINHYLVIYQNGHTEARTSVPGKGKHERYVFALTIRTDRIANVREIYRMYAEGASRNAISRWLNQSKADRGFKTFWNHESVNYVLANPIYGGVYEWKRSTQAKYATIGPDGQYLEAERTIRKVRKQGRTEVAPASRIRADDVREDLRIVDGETIAKCRARLEEDKVGQPDGRRPRSDSYWAQPYLRCGHCGGPMHGFTHSYPVKVGGDEKTRYAFKCTEEANHRQNGGSKAGTGCVPTRVFGDEIEEKLALFLEHYGAKVALDADPEAGSFSRFAGPQAHEGLMKQRLHAEMLDFVLDRLDPALAPRLGEPGGLDLVEEYRRLNDLEAGRQEALVAEMKAEVRDQLKLARKFAEGTPAHELAMESIRELSDQIASAQSAFVPLDKQYDAASRRAREIVETIKAVRRSLANRKSRVIAEALRTLVSKIEVFSVKDEAACRAYKRRRTDRIVFHPIVGEPIEYQANPPLSQMTYASIARARELLLSGLNLTDVARQMNAEGIPTARGGKWTRDSLLRPLAPEMAELTATGVFRPYQTRRRSQAATGDA